MSMLEHALEYARLGYTVVPISPGSKMPAVRWRDLQNNPWNEDQIRVHWTRNENHGIAVIPASRNTVVIDADIYKDKTVQEDFAQICVDFGIDLNEAVTVKTPSGGIHVWLQCRETIRSGADVLADGIDIRCEGGYAIVPPSLNEAGKAYQWGSAGSVFDNPILSVADPQLIARMQVKRESETAEVFDLDSFMDQPRADGREKMMRDAVFAVGMEFARRYQQAPPDELWLQMAWALYRPKVKEREGRTLEQDDRGETMMRAKIRSTRFEVQERLNKGLLDDADFERIDLPDVDQDNPLPLEFWNDGEEQYPPFDFVEDTLTDGAMSVVYGDSNVGKTFWVFDLACHIALGMPWNGKEVEQGPVIYIAAEGGGSIKKRRQAFQQHHEIEDAMLAIVPVAVDLLDEKADVSRIIEACETAAEHYSKPIRMVVFDTLSRVMAGGNENSPEDMTAVISNIDKVRHATGAHTLIVHHSGKNAAQGARGHSSLRAATDTEIEISRTGENFAVAKIRKQRDLEQADDMGFRLEKMLVGINKRGKELSSCVVLPVELDGSETVRLTPTEKRLFEIIANIFADETRIRQKAYLEFPGSAKIAVSDACPKSDIRTWFLREVGQIGHENRTLEGSSEKEVTNASRNFLRSLNSLKEKGKIMYDGQLVSLPELRVQ